MRNRDPHKGNVKNILAICLPILTMQHIRESPSAAMLWVKDAHSQKSGAREFTGILDLQQDSQGLENSLEAGNFLHNLDIHIFGTKGHTIVYSFTRYGRACYEEKCMECAYLSCQQQSLTLLVTVGQTDGRFQIYTVDNKVGVQSYYKSKLWGRYFATSGMS